MYRPEMRRSPKSRKQKLAWYKWINGRRNSDFYFLMIKISISGNNLWKRPEPGIIVERVVKHQKC